MSAAVLVMVSVVLASSCRFCMHVSYTLATVWVVIVQSVGVLAEPCSPVCCTVCPHVH